MGSSPQFFSKPFYRERSLAAHSTTTYRIELELIQAHMAQKPLLWEEVGAHAGAQKVKSAMGWGGQARVSRGVCVCFFCL
jgi:hypothetical protein